MQTQILGYKNNLRKDDRFILNLINTMKNFVPFSNLMLSKGDTISLEKTGSNSITTSEVVNIEENSIEFTAPRLEGGGYVNFNQGENINVHFWTSNGNKYIFQSVIQSGRTSAMTYVMSKPEKAKFDATRRWTRYKPINMITTFINKSHTSKINDIVHVGRVVNISAGGMLILTPKRFNVGDTLGISYYVKEQFFTAICTVKSCENSKADIGKMEVALQFTSYSEDDKEYLEDILSLL